MNETITNHCELYHQNEKLHEVETSVQLLIPELIELRKVSDKNSYFTKEIVIYTITICNHHLYKVENLVIEDTMPPQIKPISGEEYQIRTTKGTILSAQNPIWISIPDIDSEEIVTITVEGKMV